MLTFTLLLKSKMLDFETLSLVHVYRIEQVSYRQCPYRIRIVSDADRIVPALQSTQVSEQCTYKLKQPIICFQTLC